MRKIISMLLIIGTVSFFISCSENIPSAPEFNQSSQTKTSLAKKPAPKLKCTTEYEFVGGLGIFDAQGRLLAWEGTVSGDIDGIIKWYMDMTTMTSTGQASHYTDRFEIWNSEGTMLLLAGDEIGTTTTRHGKNSNWRSNGTVTEAYGDFADWLGRKEHAEGHFTWAAPGLPDEGYGTFRIN